MEQIAYSFDSLTNSKIIRGCLYALAVGIMYGAGDYFVEYAGTLHFGHPALEGLAVVILSSGFNAIKEFIKGNPVSAPNEENLQ